ncbi:MAG: hypothetical protein HKN92_05335 [Chitinophagales bacterium]|nr:hypothetical protein [Chitinophagales bacterium]
METYNTKITTSILFILLIITGCDFNKNRKKVDLSGIETEVTIDRFEIDMMEMDTANWERSLKELEYKYGREFLDIYFVQVLNIRNPFESEADAEFLKFFVTSPPIQSLYDSVMLAYPSQEPIESKLEGAFSYFKYYFPKRSLPEQVVTFISEFGYGAITIDSVTLGIGLDLYLGSNFRAYNNYFPQYLSKKFIPERIIVDCMSSLYNEYFGHNKDLSKALLYRMVDEAKQSVFLSYVLPEEDEHLLFGFTQEELEWCEANEEEIWKFLIDQDLLFSNDLIDKRRFLSEGPTTNGMPEEAPGRIGTWVGYNIIKEYINNSNAGIKKVITESSEMIYNKSSYKPSRR